MRFVSAVALATVMLWVPVDASGQEVTITAVEMRTDSFHENYITFVTRNNNSSTIVAWRDNLQIRNPFGDLIWENGGLIFGEDGDLPPKVTNRKERFMSHAYEPTGFYLADYQVEDMTFHWTNVQVAY